LKDTSCDFNHFFYRLEIISIFILFSKDDYFNASEKLLSFDIEIVKQNSIDTLSTWIETKYRSRLELKDNRNDSDHQKRMRKVNHKFVLRQ